MAPYPDGSNILYNKSTKRIQYIVGNMLYYAGSFDPTMLQAINEILRVQLKPTKDTKVIEKLYYIVQQHTQMQSSGINPATWSYMWIQTWHI